MALTDPSSPSIEASSSMFFFLSLDIFNLDVFAESIFNDSQVDKVSLKLEHSLITNSFSFM